jgi:hypothetical protein
MPISSGTETDIDHSIVIVGDRDEVDYNSTTWKIFQTKYQVRVGCNDAGSQPLASWLEETPLKDDRNLIHKDLVELPSTFTYPEGKNTCAYINKKVDGVPSTGPGWPGYLLCGDWRIPCKDDHEYVEMRIDHCTAEEKDTSGKTIKQPFMRQSTYVCKSTGVQNACDID